MEFFKELERVIESKLPQEKIERFEDFYEQFQKGSVKFADNFQAKKFTKPSYSDICTTVAPQDASVNRILILI